MGYELHITRAQVDWVDENDNPITATEWLDLVASDETLTVSLNDDNKYIVTDWSPIENSTYGRQMFWSRGQISMTYPSKPAYLKMLQLSEQLGGRVLGDDGELYTTPDDYHPPNR